MGDESDRGEKKNRSKSVLVLIFYASLRLRVSSLAALLAKLRAEVNKVLSIVIYTKPGCPYCQQARDYYNSNSISFTDYDAQNDRERRQEMLAYSDGDPTVPCIVKDGEYIGSGWGTPPRG